MTSEQWLREAIDLSRRCPPTDSAYNVGAIIVSAGGERLAEGFSRETDPHVHAEESALHKVEGQDLTGATIYSSLEPCSIRKSRPAPCVQLILESGIQRVVFALREPPIFVECHGVQELQDGGVKVVELPKLAGLVRDINAHVLAPSNTRDAR